MPADAEGAHSPLSRVVSACAARPRAVVLAALLVTLLAALLAVRDFSMDTDTYALIAPNAEWRQDEAKLRAAFPGSGDTIVAVVDGATPELAESSAALLAERLGRDGAHFTSITRPDGGAFFDREGLLYLSVAQVRATTARMIGAQPFLGPLAADPSLRGVAGAVGTLAQGVARGDAKWPKVTAPMTAISDALDARAAKHPAFFSWQRLFAGASPSRRLVLATPRLDYTELMPGEAATQAIRAAARADLDPAHGITVRLTGAVPLSDEEFRSLQSNAGLVGAAMLAAMLLTLWLATRSGRVVAAILATTIAGLIMTTALGLIAVGKFNILSIAFIPLFVGLGVDFSIQFATRFRSELAVLPPCAALARAGHGLGPSLLLAAAAVALGFCAFLPTDYVGLSELGIVAGLGMIVALALSLSLLPALLVLLRVRAPARALGWAGAAPLDHWLARNRRAVLGAFAVALVASIAALPLVRFDFNPLHLRDAHSEAVSTLADLTRDPDRTPDTIEVVAPNLATANAIARRLTKLPEVRAAITLDDVVPADQPAKLAAIADAGALLLGTLDPFEVAPAPSDAQRVAALRAANAALTAAIAHDPLQAAPARRMAAAFSALANASPSARDGAEAMLVAPLKVTLAQLGASLSAEPVTLASLPPAMARDWLAPDGRARVQAFARGNPEDNATLARFTRAVLAVEPHATGAPVTTQRAAATVSHAFVEAGLIALAAIALLLFAVLRSVREVLFTLAPVALAGFLTLATCVLIGQPLNFANIIAFPLLFGVGVAFHIYFVVAWRGGGRDLLQTPLARAVFFSAMATGTAFGSLWLSDHPGTASMGKILMLSLVWTLVCALIFEPALLGPPRPIARRVRPVCA